MVAPPYLTVPPRGYGGIENVVSLLADGLSRRGHDVTLFASGGSVTRAALRSPVPSAPGPSALGDRLHALAHVLDVYLDGRHGDFDIVHDHTSEGAALAAVAGRQRVVHTLHGPWTASARACYGRLASRVHLVAISEAQRAINPDLEYAGVVPNGIDLDAHPFQADKEDFLVFVGRSNPEKGPELAVDVARRAGLPLVMVVKRAEPHEQRHWRAVVEPRLTGGETVLEDVPHAELISLVSRARAMVFPIQWDEPFGLVMTESMACGTPVITRPLGAARELVRHGETGFLCDTVDEMAAAVGAVSQLSAESCRAHVARHFSADAMVDRYSAIYERIGCRPFGASAPS